MNPSGRPRGRTGRGDRSHSATEMGILLAAILGALLTLRVLFAAVGVGDRVLAGAVVFGISAPLVMPLELAPAGRRPVLGDATLADVTAAALAVAVPFYIVGRPRRVPPR